MAKIKNEDYLRDAKAIIDRLSALPDLNRSSTAILGVARSFYDEGDGRFAFNLARRADCMDYFCRHINKG